MFIRCKAKYNSRLIEEICEFGGIEYNETDEVCIITMKNNFETILLPMEVMEYERLLDIISRHLSKNTNIIRIEGIAFITDDIQDIERNEVYRITDNF